MKAAIYSRKSVFTGKGDSIENQIELCRDYMSRNFPGEKIEYLVYEDEGFSGGNINRPKFQELLKDAQANKFNVLYVTGWTVSAEMWQTSHPHWNYYRTIILILYQ